MPILHNVPLTLSIEQLPRRQGVGELLNLRPEMITLLHELLSSVDELHLLEPAIAYELHLITEMQHDRLCLKDGTVFHGQLLPSFLKTARELAIAVCTIGPRLEEKVTDYFNRDEPLRGLLLDGIGSTAVDSLGQEVCQLIRHEASSRSYEASNSLSPGMPGLPLSEQWQLFQLVPAEQIGVHLTSSGMMSPRKSASMIIGIGPDMPTWTEAQACDRCSLKETCHYRVYTHPEATT